MGLQTIVIMGRSGCGKGTQSALLTEYFNKKDSERSVYHLQTGVEFREFITGEGYTQDISRGIYYEGLLQPIFLTIILWGKALIKNFKENQHVIIDGTPRRPAEAPILHDALNFFHRENRTIIHLKVSNEWSVTRMKGRGRTDDQRDEDIQRRLKWFEDDVKPTMELLATYPGYRFVEVNGEQTPEAVHQDILNALSFT